MQKYRKIVLFTLELGSSLCEEAFLNSILKSISTIREEIFEQYGVSLPLIHVKDNQKLLPFEYVIKVSGLETARYELKKDSLLILDIGKVTSKMRGTKTKEPAYGLPALWISAARKEEAKEKGYLLVSHEKLIRTNLVGEIKNNLAEVINFQYVEELLNEIVISHRALCEQLARKYESELLPVIKEVLKALVKEAVNITDIISILEAIANSPKTNCENIDYIVEKCRLAVAPYIISPLMEKDSLYLISVGLGLSSYISKHSRGIFTFSFDKKILKQLRNEILSIVDNQKVTPVIICCSGIRKEICFLVNELCILPGLKVISDNELSAVQKRLRISNVELLATVGENFPISDDSDDSDDKVSEKKTTEEETFTRYSNSQSDKKAAYAVLQKQLKSILEKIPEQEREVLSMRFGLDGDGCHTLEEIGLYFNLTREEIRCIEAKALRLLRKNKNNGK